MYDRPWQHVLDLYSNAVEGKLSVLHLFEPKVSFFIAPLASRWLHPQIKYLFFFLFLQKTLAHDDGKTEGKPLEAELETCTRKDGRTGRWERVNFRIVLSYNGASFDGWQKQPDLHTVQR